MARNKLAPDRTETPETTNMALRIILKDLDVLVQWAEADAARAIAAVNLDQAAEDYIRARTYQRCRNQLARAFK